MFVLKSDEQVHVARLLLEPQNFHEPFIFVIFPNAVSNGNLKGMNISTPLQLNYIFIVNLIEREALFIDSLGFHRGLRFPPTLHCKSPNICRAINV
jgi:hypothetical protein